MRWPIVIDLFGDLVVPLIVTVADGLMTDGANQAILFYWWPEVLSLYCIIDGIEVTLIVVIDVNCDDDDGRIVIIDVMIWYPVIDD